MDSRATREEPNEQPEEPAAAKKGEPSRNPEGKNGQEWRQSFRKYFGADDFDLDDKENAKKAIEGDAKAIKACRRAARIENVWRATYRAALAGDKGAREFIIEHMQGAIPQSVEVSGPGGTPVGGGPTVVLTMPDNGRGPKDLDPDDVGDGPPSNDGNTDGN